MGRSADDEPATVRLGGERPRAGKDGRDRDDTEPIAFADQLEATVLPPRFEPIAVIGSGGMGRVVRVLDRSLNREVAVKLLKLQQLADERTRLRFLREARAAGTLHHPNIVTVHDVAPDGTYLVMELVEGESLAARLRRDKRLPLGEVRRIGAALLGALAAAHAAGIIHRDVKPANVLIDATGAVKLTDFGVASFGDSELTSTGQTIGTPAYMAPEQLRARHVDERADIYAAGATLFEVATGIRLNNDKEQVGDPERAVVEATGDRGLARTLARAVREKETERFATAADFSRALANEASARPRRWRVSVGALAVAIAAAPPAAVMVERYVHRSAAVEVAPRSGPLAIAMLPFENHAGDPRLDFAASGLAHMLGDRLGHVEHVHVLGYYRVRDRVTDPDGSLAAWRDAARKLGAQLAIRGEITPVGDHVRVAVIVERADGTQVRQIEREVSIDRVPEAVEALAPEIASIAVGAPSALHAAAPHGFEIERELQLGIAAFERQDFDEAASHLTAAVARDDSVAEAHYYLAILDWWRVGSDGGHIDRALAGRLEPTERDFLVGLKMLIDLDYPRAVDYFRDLAKRAPEHRDVHYGLFEALFHGGYPQEAMDAYLRLHELAPSFMVGGEHAMLYYLTRGDAGGIAWIQHNWQPPADERAVWIARSLVAQRRPSDAVAALE
ncbi:MAG: protein kinase domain-containing protein, partial [Acidobacteriota bacterium]